MKSILHTSLFIAAFLMEGSLAAQDTIPPQILLDSFQIGTFDFDSLAPQNRISISVSPDSIDAPVEYGSIDSNYLDNETRRVYLYGEAFVKYKDLSLTADYIVVDLDSSIAYASGLPDSLGEIVGKPIFTMGEESFPSDVIRYNFKSRKGFIYNAVAEEGDLLIRGNKTKFVAATSEKGREDDVLYNEGALITSCTHPEPHYGIRAKKVKTIPDKLAVVGASRLELFGVPTPIMLPFGFYPVSETRAAGVIFPRDYERSPQWGFGVRDFGYYFPIKDWAEARLTGDIYFNGSWGVAVSSNYLKKYKFRGSVTLGYSNRITEATNSYQESSRKSFKILLSHSQDPKAHPYQTIQGSINIQTQDYQSLNYNDAASVLTSSYSSNFSYHRIFPGKPYSLSLGLSHSQNTETHAVRIDAPDINFRINRVYPFKRQNRIGPEQWYEKIAFTYAGQGKSQINTTDTALFDQKTWQRSQLGAKHDATASTNFSVLKYFNFTPSVNYDETWFFKTRERTFRFDPNDPMFVRPDTLFFPDGTINVIVPDTINPGIVDDDNLKSGFKALRNMSASINMNTQIFGMIQGTKGWFRGIRHVIKPNIGLSYSPPSVSDTAKYYQFSRFSIEHPDSMKQYSRLDDLLFGVRPDTSTQALLNYSFTNLFEAKYFSRKDSTEKKLKLFDNINVSGNYNMAADVNKWSPINISGNTRFFKGITTVTVGASYSFYALNENGRLSPEFYSKQTNHLLRFDNMRLRFSTNLGFQDIMDIFLKKKNANRETAPKAPGTASRLPSSKDKFLDLLNRFSVNHEFQVNRFGMIGRDTTVVVAHTVNMVGSMQITPNWSVRFGNIGYDFQSNQLTYPDIGLARDLHCWEMSFNFQPTRGTYSFHIGVKPGSFDFLKFPHRRGNEAFGF